MNLFYIITFNLFLIIPNIVLFAQSTNESLTPKEIVVKYLDLYNERKFNERYNFLASISKTNINKDEYINFYKDVFESDIQCVDIITSEIEAESNQSRYRRIKVDYFTSLKGEEYIQREYYTFINENGKWKIVWTRLMKALADEKVEISDFKKAIELFNKIIDMNPYDAYSYDRIAWCYIRDQNLAGETRKKEIFNNSKKAIFFEPDISEYYRTMSIYYHLEKLDNLQLDYINKAIDLALNESDKSIYYSDLSQYYMDIDYSKSLDYINKAIQLNSSDPYCWYQLGIIHKNYKKYENAKDAFKKALLLKPMEDYFQAGLYGSYSYTCYSLNMYDVAKIYIVKALELDPTNSFYKFFFEINLKDK